MNLDYIISNRTDGANPFRIFDASFQVDQERLCYSLKAMPYSQFLRTAYWFAVSSVAKSKAGMRCQVCNSKNNITTHHRTYDTHGREHANMSDLVALCENCHGLFHGHSSTVPVIEQPPELKPKRERKQFDLSKTVDVESEMPGGDLITLTIGLVNRCRANGSFTNATVDALGVPPGKLQTGWCRRLEGRVISREQYRAALLGRYIYGAKRAK